MKPALPGVFVRYPASALRPELLVLPFQFNPEQLTRTLEVPQRPAGVAAREVSQAGDIPVERIQMTIQVTADDPRLNLAISTIHGIAPQLAALEALVRPTGPLSDTLAKVLDEVGQAISGVADATNPVPREQYPGVLFVWGAQRALPVLIDSMQITEQQFDRALSPIRAEISIGLTVIVPDRCSNDLVAKGASTFSEGRREVLAALAVAQSGAFDVSQLRDVVRF